MCCRLAEQKLNQNIDFPPLREGVGLHLSLSLGYKILFLLHLCRIRKFLKQKSLLLLADSLVSSRLDYCNSLLYTVTKRDLNRIQRVQNTLCHAALLPDPHDLATSLNY